MKSLFKFYIKIRNKSREPAEKKPRCLHNLRRKTTSTAQFTPYTWVYRWQNEREFDLNKKLTTVEAARHAIVYNTDTHRYLKQILENKAHIVVYHKADESKLKHCSDIDHFHMITWHHQHPTSEHGFILLKKNKLMSERSVRPYSVSAPKVYNPYGLCQYFEKEPDKLEVVAAGNLITDRQLKMLRRMTDKELTNTQEDSSDEDINNKKMHSKRKEIRLHKKKKRHETM